MAHEIETMFYRFAAKNDVPWHGLGKPVSEDISIADAIIEAGLNWKVEKVPLVTFDDHVVTDGFAVRRMSDKRVLGTVKKKFQPLQNEDVFNWFSPFIENKLVKLETAGSLRNGQRVWVMGRIQTDALEVVKGDAILPYLLLSHGHDGSLAISVSLSLIRTVCANTLASSLSNSATKSIKIRHSSQAKINLDKLRETIDLAKSEFTATVEQYRGLANKGVCKKDLEKYVKIVYGVEHTPAEEISTRMKNMLNKVYEKFENGRGQNVGVKHTYWNAYNAITETLSWDTGRNLDNRYNSLWFGEGLSMNKFALETALTMAA